MVHLKILKPFCFLFLLLLLLPLLTIDHKAGHYCHFRVLHSVNSDTGRKKKKKKNKRKKNEQAYERIFVKTHSTERKCLIGPKNMFLRVVDASFSLEIVQAGGVKGCNTYCNLYYLDYLARSEKEMGAVPGGAPNTFWDPEYRQSISRTHHVYTVNY